MKDPLRIKPDREIRFPGVRIVWHNSVFFFRVFGYGLHFKDFRKGELLFSQRNFFIVKKPVLIVGYWIIKILKPRNLKLRK
jgi:hypothetical protein